jgi:nucleotide-binding universal stress UspA family protein
MIEIEQILCPVDLSAISGQALTYAVVMARWYEARVTVLEVVSEPFPPTPFAPVSAATLTPDERRDFEAGLDTFVAGLVRNSVDVATTVKEGQVVHEILQEARALPADLIVLGTHGRSGFEHLLLGSVTERVLRKATCPVLTVPPQSPAANGRPAPFRDVLCAIDFSPASLNALAYALSIAQEAGGRLALLHVLDWPVDRPEPAGVASDLHAYRRHLQDDAFRQLRAAVPDEARNWCEPVELVVIGKPYREILKIARERDMDLIVMGVHGRHAAELHLFGSTTDHVIREAVCPVLTIRP